MDPILGSVWARVHVAVKGVGRGFTGGGGEVVGCLVHGKANQNKRLTATRAWEAKGESEMRGWRGSDGGEARGSDRDEQGVRFNYGVCLWCG
ncbi:hypothetical protein TIFTF001_000570 [Ficus carica]|uniref:Uncharacterized protein n=1 Tax=Ficus carica TaxID=3494 RepID=A0AA87YVE3_FICCA|nr:hypothetical protein TIFTF001_000570 [Ficus carica]